MQQGLALALAAEDISLLAIGLQLPDVPFDIAPAPDLPRVLVGQPAAAIVAAVPLKPAARIVRMEPALPAPFRQWLAGADAEEVQLRIGAFRRQLRLRKPACRKFLRAVGHVFAA